jgi:protein arginine kinase activator
MLCDICHKNEASIFITEIVNGQVTKRAYCEQCYKKREEALASFPIGLTLMSALADLAGLTGEEKETTRPRPVRTCPKCGLTYSDFQKSGFVGCERCWETFSRELEQILRRIHGSSSHHGKIPRGVSGEVQVALGIKQLQEQLRSAVQREDFEAAAKLRDQIRALKKGPSTK